MNELSANAIDVHGVDAIDEGAGKGIFHSEKNTNLLHVILQVVTNLWGRSLIRDRKLGVGLQHALPPGPVVAGIVAPYVEAARDAFVAEDLRHASVRVPALV